MGLVEVGDDALWDHPFCEDVADHLLAWVVEASNGKAYDVLVEFGARYAAGALASTLERAVVGVVRELSQRDVVCWLLGK